MIFVGKSLWQMVFFGFTTNFNKSSEVKASGLILASIKLSKNSRSVISKSVKFAEMAQKITSFRNRVGFLITDETFNVWNPEKEEIPDVVIEIVRIFK